MIKVDQKLWDKYRAGDRDAYDQLVEGYLPLVKITVGRMAMNLPNFIEYEELYSTGCMGLLNAIERYDPGREAKFTTYAITRIRGSVIDELRQHDMLGRITRDRVTRIKKAEEELRGEGKTLSPEDIAERAGVTTDEYFDAVMGDRASRMISLSEPVSSAEGAAQTLSDLLEAKGMASKELLDFEDDEILAHIEQMLTDREKLLVALYYHEELTLKEIGKVMEVSESRISQLHAEMVEKVRRNLKKIGI
ncbi:MAG: sigma-70 family RNA polymerase sigma factor [Planctomycetota bacterium]|jgi:RNA polymerase sigma factor for flagellar operon FliA